MDTSILVTGFEPFGGAPVNASWEAVRRLPERIGSHAVRTLLLPVEYRTAAGIALAAAEELRPALILLTGVAGGRRAITPERIAVNWCGAALPDNAGCIRSGERIDPRGRDGIFSTLPVDRMAAALLAAGLPAEVSMTAGTFVCNDVFYRLMCRYGDHAPPCGFIHLPPGDCLSPERCREGLEICIREALAPEKW